MCQMKSGNISKSDFYYTGDKLQICGFVTNHFNKNKNMISIAICIIFVIVVFIISITLFISNI
jgi:hypothetical protein